MIQIGNLVVESLSEDTIEKLERRLLKNSKKALVEMLIAASINSEDLSLRCESFRQELMIGKKSIGGVVV